MNKKLIVWLVVCLVIIIGSWLYILPKLGPNSGNGAPGPTTDNVSLIDGQQVIEITAKGGYWPRVTSAKAGLPTVIRVKTNNSYDCSVALTIPKLGYRDFLGASVTKDIPLTADQAQGSLRGVCSMGMYGFEIKFE